MVGFLIIISLIFNVIAILAIIILYLRQNKLLQVEEQQKKAMAEMESLINSYLLEIKDENKRFIHRVKEMKDEKQEQMVESFPSTDNMKSALGPEKADKTQNSEFESAKNAQKDNHSFELTSKLEKTVSLQAVKAYQQQTKVETSKSLATGQSQEKGKSILEMKQAFSHSEKEKTKQSDALIKDSLLTQVMIMKKEGLSVKEMAKKLKKGKTEIELLLKFREK
jgi:hypothetical protein